MRRNNRGAMNNPLADLDRELELLRRKRELIEEQQKLLNRPIKISPWAEDNVQNNYGGFSQRNYIEPSVTAMYDSGRGFSSERKRRGDASWQAAAPAPKRGVGRSAEARRGLSRREFSQGGRPKPRPNAPPKPTDLLFLEEGVEPSHQTQGRLGLVIGDIVARIKSNKRYADYLATEADKKAVKQNIRTRLYSLYMGKALGSREGMNFQYWKKFPNTDELIAESHPTFKVGDRRPDKAPPKFETPDKNASTDIKPKDPIITDLKRNGMKMLDFQLENMFEKLEKLYVPDEGENPIDIIKDIITSRDEKTDTDSSTTNNGEQNKNTETNIDEKAKSILDHYQKLFAIIFRHQVPSLLPTHKWRLMKIINSPQSIEEGEAAYKNSETQGITQNDVKEENNAKEESKNAGQRKRKQFPYFVSVIGNPKLPKPADISKFLEPFNTSAVKKHRSITNVLFVGLESQDDFERLVAASGTVIDNSTILVKPSNKTKAAVEKGNEASTNDEPAETDETANVETSSSDDVMIVEDKQGDVEEENISINTEMEKKIDELLESIKGDTQSNDEETPKDFDENVAEDKQDTNEDETCTVDEVNTEVDDAEKPSNEDKGEEQDAPVRVTRSGRRLPN